AGRTAGPGRQPHNAAVVEVDAPVETAGQPVADVADAREWPGQPHAEHFALAAELQGAGRGGGGAAVDVGVSAEQVERHAGAVDRDPIPGADDGDRVDGVGRELHLRRKLVVEP